MNHYLPSAFPPPLWFTAPCPLCAALIRSGKAETLPRAVNRYLTMVHPGEHVPEPDTSQDTHKTITIVAVHYSGSRKRLRAEYANLKTAVVPVAFPGDVGVAVVRDGRVLVYERLGAGVSGWKIEL